MNAPACMFAAVMLAAGLGVAPAAAAAGAPAGPGDDADPLERAGQAGQATGAGDPAAQPVQLTDAELETLAAGDDVIRHQRQAGFASALVVFDVAASPRQVWQVLNTFERYPAWIDNVTVTEVYRRDAGGVYVRFQARTPFGPSWVWFARHVYPVAQEAPLEGLGTWELDQDYRSTFRAAYGYWRVAALPGDGAGTRVTYASNIRLRGVTALFRGMVVRRMIREGPAWVRRALAAAAAPGDGRREAGGG